MDPSQVGLLIALIILIVLSAFFSASETAYTTVNKVRLRTLAQDGNKKAEKALKMADNYDRLLSTILVGNNIVNIVVASLSTVFFANIIKSNASLSVTVSTIASTVALLIFSEITPKSIAKEYPESFCMSFNGAVRVFYFILTPVNELFMLWKKLIKKVFRLSSSSSVTEDELKTYVEVAESGGEISEHESELIRSAIEFDDLDIYDIMTPRVNVVAVEENDSIEEIAKKFFESGYSRLPVYSKTVDSIIGIIHEKDFYFMKNGDGKKLSDIIQSSVCVSKTMKISAVLRIMQKAKIHMAVVVDEFGGTSGIVTMEDIIEELIGEVWDEHDEVEVLLKRVDDDSYLVSGAENLEAMFEALGVKVKEEFDSITVGGWVIEQMGKIPVAGEKLEFQNLIITITKATVKKVVEVRVKVIPPEEE